jgi:hypothetical protein
MKEQWNERYSASEYIYGTGPNTWLVEKLAGLQPGKILFPAEGEGRNAVHAARLGWNVAAFDQSEAGRKKALKLAEISPYIWVRKDNTGIGRFSGSFRNKK